MPPIPTLSIVVPCYNEQQVLPVTLNHLQDLLNRLLSIKKIAGGSRIFFVDDGSKDLTWSLIEASVNQGAPVVGVKLSRNCGHQNALLAGIERADGDVIISMDADLQDDTSAIERMVDEYMLGADIVLGVRSSRNTDTLFKRLSARFFYWFLRRMGAETIDNHADFRLLSRRAAEALLQYQEVNLYLRGIVPKLGFKTAVVNYARMARFAGESKYPLRRMLALSLDAITSFSTVPLRLITIFGLGVSLIAAGLGFWILLGSILGLRGVPGWASTVLPIYFIGGLQLLGIGVIGEYVGKIYLETKRRPRYLVERVFKRE